MAVIRNFIIRPHLTVWSLNHLQEEIIKSGAHRNKFLQRQVEFAETNGRQNIYRKPLAETLPMFRMSTLANPQNRHGEWPLHAANLCGGASNSSQGAE